MLAPIGRGRWPARARGAFAVVLTAVALVGPWVRPAAAHAILLETTPANDELVERAPSEVRLRFDEGVDTFDGSIRVFDSSGDRVDGGQVRQLEDGAVVVAPVDGRRQGTYSALSVAAGGGLAAARNQFQDRVHGPLHDVAAAAAEADRAAAARLLEAKQRVEAGLGVNARSLPDDLVALAPTVRAALVAAGEPEPAACATESPSPTESEP